MTPTIRDDLAADLQLAIFELYGAAKLREAASVEALRDVADRLVSLGWTKPVPAVRRLREERNELRAKLLRVQRDLARVPDDLSYELARILADHGPAGGAVPPLNRFGKSGDTFDRVPGGAAAVSRPVPVASYNPGQIDPEEPGHVTFAATATEAGFSTDADAAGGFTVTPAATFPRPKEWTGVSAVDEGDHYDRLDAADDVPAEGSRPDLD